MDVQATAEILRVFDELPDPRRAMPVVAVRSDSVTIQNRFPAFDVRLAKVVRRDRNPFDLGPPSLAMTATLFHWYCPQHKALFFFLGLPQRAQTGVKVTFARSPALRSNRSQHRAM
jgi:hypothetical protein